MKKKSQRLPGINECYLNDIVTSEPIYFGGKHVYRVSLGRLMPSEESCIHPANPHIEGHQTKTGSVGYMDLVFGQTQLLKHTNSEDDITVNIVDAAIIKNLGIEPRYRRRGYAKYLLQKAERIAGRRGIEVIVAESVRTKEARELFDNMGYQFQSNDLGSDGQKRLNLGEY